jgi:hypothetical protein
MWPRVDQRFVGTWRLTMDDDSYYWTFLSDGTGEEWAEYAGKPTSKYDWRWYFDGNAIVTRRPGYEWADHIPLRILIPFNRLTNRRLDQYELIDEYPVRSVEPNLLRAEMLWADEAFTLDRVQE